MGEEEIMTGDEWVARGIQCAFSAEGSNTLSLLQKAVECFERAGNRALMDRATAQLDAFLVRQDLEGMM
jgi:hypothetical protein